MTTRELCRHAGITYRQADHWTSRGYLTATSGGDGIGYPREYDDTTARHARLMAQLVRIGMQPAEAHAIAQQMRAEGFARCGDFLIVRAAV